MVGIVPVDVMWGWDVFAIGMGGRHWWVVVAVDGRWWSAVVAICGGY